MGVEVWEPGAGKELDKGLLTRLVALAGEVGEAVMPAHLSHQGLESAAWVMRLEAGAWALADDLDSDDIVRLIRLFTLLEFQLSGWEAGRQSPVIPLVKVLRHRGEFDSTLRKWIKAHTDNRYLPHGSAL